MSNPLRHRVSQCGRTLFFEASQECLGALAADAECAALEACIPETVNVDCEGYCTQLEAWQSNDQTAWRTARLTRRSTVLDAA